ncbi:MAG: anaerobic ribonucleoside-triphosphate reductase [Candidatus Pacebacteria bacterium]|nr:anaerobic ribonucleoside-triphosphate reductase [Candidatus Paceibacterota bacterium]
MKKILCHDCKKVIELKEEEIKDGFRVVYKKDGKVITIFKCKNCFSKNKALNNFQDCEVYSRVVGYLRPVKQWNQGKQKEFKQRKEYKI